MTNFVGLGAGSPEYVTGAPSAPKPKWYETSDAPPPRIPERQAGARLDAAGSEVDNLLGGPDPVKARGGSSS